jgi:hypothetical protein
MAGKWSTWRLRNAPSCASFSLVPVSNTSPDTEPRRSGRATKGKHTRNIDLEPPEPPAAPKKSVPKKKTEKRASQAPSAIDEEEKKEEENDEEGESNEIIRCVCGAQDEEDDDGRMMVQCEQCEAWQHNQCLLIPNTRIPEHYYCELCKPELHIDFLERVKNGEKPWMKKKKGRKSTARGRKSTSKAESEKAESEITHSAAPTQPGSPAAVAQDHQHHSRKPSSVDVVDPSLQNHQPQQQQQSHPTSARQGEDVEMADVPPVSRDSTVEIQPPTTTSTNNIPDRDATESPKVS